MKKLLLIPLLALAVLAGPLKTAIIPLGWTPSPDLQVTGYKIYYVTNITTFEPLQLLATVQGRLTSNTVVTVPVDIGFLVATAFSTNVITGTNYTFAESDFSNPVFLKTLKAGADFGAR